MNKNLPWAIAFNNNQYILFVSLSKQNIKPEAIVLKDGSAYIRQDSNLYDLEDNSDTPSLLEHLSKLSYICVSDIDENGNISHDYQAPVSKT